MSDPFAPLPDAGSPEATPSPAPEADPFAPLPSPFRISLNNFAHLHRMRKVEEVRTHPHQEGMHVSFFWCRFFLYFIRNYGS